MTWRLHSKLQHARGPGGTPDDDPLLWRLQRLDCAVRITCGIAIRLWLTTYEVLQFAHGRLPGVELVRLLA